MLSVSAVSKSFGVEPILKKINFHLNAGERLGLVGVNGSGKTTLLRILAGQETPDEGAVTFTQPGLRLGYLAQGQAFEPGGTVASFLARQQGDLPALEAQLARLAEALGANPADAALQQAYDQTLTRLETAAQQAAYAPAVLAGLGLDGLDPAQPAGQLSGGQKTRLALAGILLAGPNLLLLDEPTNHLDLEMLNWLEEWLLGYPGGALLVSHDRAFLDRTATGILELDAQTHSLKTYPGNYTAYLEARLAEQERRWSAYADQQAEIARLKSSAAAIRSSARMKKGGKGDSGDKFAKGFFANRMLERVRRAKALERRLEALLGEDHIEKPRPSWQMKLDFGEPPASGRDVIRLEQLSIGYTLSTNGSAPLLAGLSLGVRYGERIALVGPNGCGKTTLLRVIAGWLPPLAGSVHLGSGVRLGYMAQEQEDFDAGQDAFETIRRLAPLSETETRAFLHRFLFSGDDVFRPVGRLSFGERARLKLACLVAGGCNLLLLDEPVNHLDIPSRARFEQALEQFEGAVLAVSHDRYFIEGFATQLWRVVPGAPGLIELRHMD